MRKSISVKQKKRGRPATGQAPFVGVRLTLELIARVEAWGAEEGLSRSEAIRRLVELGLKANAGGKDRG
jgi:hypothetical protein